MKQASLWMAGAMLGAVLGTGAGASAAEPAAWPQFRGPGGSGVAENAKPPIEVGPDKNVKWKVKVPAGSSSPIVVGDRIVLTAFEGGKLYTIAYGAADGKELWRAEAPAKTIEPYHKTEGSPAASTPATDGTHIVSYFGSCGLFGYDLSGKQLWHYEMPPAATVADFGSGVSPVLADGLVVLVRDEMKDPKIVALDAATGQLKWEKKRPGCVSCFSTPAIWETPAGRQIAVPGYGRMVGYDLKTGEEKWSVAGMPSACCTTPVAGEGVLLFAGWSPGDPSDDFKMPGFDDLLKAAGEEKLGHLTKAGSQKTMLKDFFDNNDPNKDGIITREEWDANQKFMSASRNSAFALKPGGSGDVTGTHVVWKQAKGLPYVPSALLYRGQYFMVKDGGFVTAYDARTGKPIYVQQRACGGRFYASPVAAAGHIYVTSLGEGVITVLKAGTDKPEIVASNPELGDRVAATPAIAGDTLYVRTAHHLYAFAEKK